jgi:UrcA family protein
MVMYSGQLSASQRRGIHSIFNAQSVKESVMSITKIVRTSALRTAWIMVTFAPMVMLYNSARADESVDTIAHKVVSFRDLNLETPEGAAVLYRRIRSAAYEVCENPSGYDLSQLKMQTCIKDAVSRAVTQVNRPLLTSLYKEKAGKSDKKVTLAQAH